jgi:hypothetical protein
MKTYSGYIESLEENQIFVFGSNPEGRHGGGTARIAYTKYGAVYGKGRGLQGQSYALVTKNLSPGFREESTGITYHSHGYRSVLTPQIIENIRELYETARSMPDKEFLVAYTTGFNLNGYSGEEMASMFSAIEIPDNVVFNEDLAKLMKVDV